MASKKAKRRSNTPTKVATVKPTSSSPAKAPAKAEKKSASTVAKTPVKSPAAKQSPSGKSTAPGKTTAPAKKTAPDKKIIAAQSDSQGKISAVKFDGSKSFTPIDKAIEMAEKGQIAEFHVVTKKDGSKYLRSNPSRKGSSLEQMAKQ
jgi:hypothetical protein